MTALILEDESIAIQRLVRMLGEIDPAFEIVATFDTIEDTAAYLIENVQPDVLFLDIHVADGNSLELFNIMEVQSRIIFITAYDQYAVEAFRKNAVHYLLKPIKINDLRDALSRLRDTPESTRQELKGMLTRQRKERFLIKLGTKLIIVNSHEIAYVISENKISYFVLHDGRKIPSDFKMNDIIDSMDDTLFFRINRQCIANIKSIHNIKTHTKSRLKIELSPPYNDELVVSTETTPLFKNWVKGGNSIQ